ncbi:MAG: response regulator [Oscillatoria sp. SIO1A7]|nr:response regulator [Oscillatoria sp. SIO1A7]
MTVSLISEPQRSGATPMLVQPFQALQTVAAKQMSGRLSFRAPQESQALWQIYLGGGKIHFATSTIGQRERLAYFLQWYYPELQPQALPKSSCDYQFVCDCWKEGQLSLEQVRKLLFWMIQEAIVQVLALPKSVLKYDKTAGLDPILLSQPLNKVVLPMRGAIKNWQQLQPEISSPFQRPKVKNIELIPKVIRQHTQNLEFIKSLEIVLQEGLCLYEAARALKTDALGMARLWQPLVQAGAIAMTSYVESCCRCRQADDRLVIACIDDSLVLQRNVAAILEAGGYRTISITEPAKALTALVRYKPALILMDVDMPDINGYELCRMLHQASSLKNIPIVMLTGREAMVDKLRARMAGAKGFITKPFKPIKLLSMVEKKLSIRLALDTEGEMKNNIAIGEKGKGRSLLPRL